ncbi:amidohydrolase family protein [Chitinispirillales bacterium ANBcel5]|uniref:amidohydrolase family protein n=1 Tax=Cellulosispirillum alkaliphilum TaxID=3039283 RepID=UPI002A563FA2|nr:amidohydrolase family protein [Chitinispirillales bacterium ANBcel5]
MAEQEQEKEQTCYAAITMGSAGFCGAINLSDFKPLPPQVVSCIIDSHMHIQSGACAPLPLIYKEIASKLRGFNPRNTRGLRSRSWIDGIGSVILGWGGKLQTMDSETIGDHAIIDNAETYLNLKNSPDFGLDQTRLILLANQKYKEDDYVFCPMIVMPMDMEFAHIAGYDGQTIYHEENGKIFYYHRRTGLFAEELGEVVDLSHEVDTRKKALKLKKWERQEYEHISSAIANPLKLIPMYHYEPRRWRANTIEETDRRSYSIGGWEFPFQQIATETKPGLFLGFKMYSALGYRPLDDKLPNMEKYYQKCEAEKIPVLNHCSPKGMLTHEQPFYKDFIEQGIKHRTNHEGKVERDNSIILLEKTITPTRHETFLEEANEWFSQNYVHPKAWRKVLDKYPNLHLCLAHFGGDDWEDGVRSDTNPDGSDWIEELIDMLSCPKYPNLYTDISCFSINENMPHFIRTMKDRTNHNLWDKILFGTDWYMTLIVSPSGQKAYKDFCTKIKASFDEIDDSFWVRATLLNPMRFFGLENNRKIGQLYDGLYLKLQEGNISTESLENYFYKFKKAIETIENVKNSI